MLRHLPKNAAMQRLDLERSARQQHVLPEDRVHQSGPRQRPRFRQQRPNTASKNNKVLLIKDGGLKRTHVCIVVAAVYCGLHSVVRLGCPSQPLPVLLRTDVVFPMSFLSFPSPLQYKGPPPHPHPHPSPAPSPRPPSPPTPVPPPPTPPYPFQDHTLGWTARIANFVSLLNVRVFPTVPPLHRSFANKMQIYTHTIPLVCYISARSTLSKMVFQYCVHVLGCVD